MSTTLVIGLGNILLGDEGVGVEVINILKEKPLPPSVVLMDGGTGGIDLLPKIIGSDRVVIIDAAKMGLTPGEYRTFQMEDIAPKECPEFSLHDLALPDILKLGSILSELPPILLIGVEPATIEMNKPLSDTIRKSLPSIVSFSYEAILDFTQEVVH